MNIHLGNLELKNVVEEDYLEKVSNFLNENGFQKENKCDDIKKQLGNYHIFDIPRLIIICNEGKMQEFIKFLQTEDIVGKGFKGAVGVSYVDLLSSLDKPLQVDEEL